MNRLLRSKAAIRSLHPRGLPSSVRTASPEAEAVNSAVPGAQPELLRVDEGMAVLHACPSCGVKAYFSCQGVGGRTMSSPHVARARMAAVARLQREGM